MSLSGRAEKQCFGLTIEKGDFQKMRLSLAPLATTLVVILLPFLADAQPKNPPLNVEVTNTPLSITALTPLAITSSAPLSVTASAPLPVTLVSPAVGASVTCSWDLGSSSNAAPVSLTAEKGTPLSSSLKCPPNTAAIDVQRVIFDPYGGSLPSINVASYTLTVAIGTFAGLGGSFTNVLASVPNPSLIAMFTQGAPEKTFTTPVRVTLSATVGFALNGSCHSGILTISPTCGGSIYIIGVPVP